MKKIAVAAALMLVAVGASASNFRAADQVYIPVAGHLQGSSGTFISDVYLANLTDDTVSVSVIYQPIGANLNPPAGQPIGVEFKNVIELAPRERKEFLDFFQSALGQPSGFGQLIFNGCKKGEDCGVATQDPFTGVSEHFRDIAATSRVYQIPNGSGANPPTTGQLFTGIPWYHFVSAEQAENGLDKVFIQGVTHTGVAGQPGTFRTNLGVANASQYSFTTIIFKLYRGRLRDEDLVDQYQVQLGPLGNIQVGFADAFPRAPLGGNYFVTVEQRPGAATSDAPADCTAGCPAFLAFGSVLDNISGDATSLESVYLKALPADAIDVIYPQSVGGKPLRRSVRH